MRFQIAVTALLLAESRNGKRSFVELVPEGYEDIDGVDSDGMTWFMQVKEVGAGAGTFTMSALAEVITHAAQVAGSGARVVAITDGIPGKGLVETGWERTLGDADGVDVVRLTAAVIKGGHSREAADDLLRRTHLVRLPWNVSVRAVASLAETFGVPRAIASLAFAALVDDVAQLAADQRRRTAETAGRRRIGDLDQLVARVLDVVDRDQLDSAVFLGVCGPADFTSRPAVAVHEFLLGVDAEPTHIAADFDVIRPIAGRAVQEALDDARYALLTGPSGAGKSAQLWRSARDRSTGARVVRVHRVMDDTDVRELVRHVQLLGPTSVSPVVVACDDLGRPHTASWPLAARRLLQIPDALLLGAVRSEDLTPDLLRHGGVLVELTLDDSTARAIAAQLEATGLELALEVSEAVSLADGHLMEFVSLLTSGRRLRAVLADQAHDLLTAPDPTAAQIARLVCAAHVLGVSLHADWLTEAIATGNELTAALRRLQDEHLITTSGDEAWRGLHQRRSDVLTEFLHETPPPTLRGTLTTVINLLPPAAVGWALRRIVEIYGDAAENWDLAEAATAAVSRCSTARDVAVLLEGIERADHAITARAYIPVLQGYRRPTLSLLNLATFALARKLAGISFGEGMSGRLGAFGRDINACAEELPDPSSAMTTAAAAVLGPETITELITAAGLEDAVRLLEIAGEYVRIGQEHATRIARRFPWPDELLKPASRHLNSRLIAAVHLAVGDTGILTAAFGTLESRLQNAAQSHPDTLAAQVGTDRTQVELELLAPLDPEGEEVTLPWDLPTARSDADNTIHRAAVELASYIGECCPEVETVEVRTLTAKRGAFAIGGYEPGHMRLGKDARPDRHLIRRSVGLQAAIGRQSSAFSWTELARRRAQLAAEVGGLASEAPRRLSSYDNPRRRGDWVARVVEVDRGLAQLPRPPLKSEFDFGSSSPAWEVERDEEPLVKRLRKATTALRMLVPDAPGQSNPVGVAGNLEKAGSFRETLAESAALVVTHEAQVYSQLDEDLERLRGILLAVAFDDRVAAKIKGSPEALDSTVDRLIKEAAAAQLAKERERIAAQFDSVPGATVHQIPSPEPFITSIVAHQWVMTLPPDGWDAAVAVAANASGTDARVVDVPLSFVCEMDGSLLPIAGTLSQMVESGFLPLAADRIAVIADALDMLVVEGAYTSLVAEIVEQLVKASWLNARSRHRPGDWLQAKGDAHKHLDAAVQLLDEKLDPKAANLATESRTLIDQVREEIDGVATGRLAAAISSGVSKPDTVAGDVLTALAKTLLTAIDLELAASGSGPS